MDLLGYTPNAGPFPYNNIKLHIVHALVIEAVPARTNVY